MQALGRILEFGVPVPTTSNRCVANECKSGVVYETMQMAHVKEFDVGGTIHVIVNNQVVH